MYILGMNASSKNWETEDGLLVSVIRVGGQMWEISVRSLSAGCGISFQPTRQYLRIHGETQVEQDLIEQLRTKRDAILRTLKIERLTK
jgi:hypothetical protein